MLIFEAALKAQQRTHQKGIERVLTLTPYVEPMFSTGHDEANRAVFLAENDGRQNLAGLLFAGQKRR